MIWLWSKLSVVVVPRRRRMSSSGRRRQYHSYDSFVYNVAVTTIALLFLLAQEHRMQASAWVVLPKQSLQRMPQRGSCVSSLAATSTITEHWALLDGAEWVSIQHHLRQQGLLPPSRPSRRTSVGAIGLVTGHVQGERVIGLLAVNNNNNAAAAADSTTPPVVVALDQNPNVLIYQDSMARLPTSISDTDAARTFHNAWAAVHCCLVLAPRGVGGDESIDTSVFSSNDRQHVVVVGGNEQATTAARALSALNCRVTVVSTNAKSSWTPPAVYRVMSPSSSSDNDNDDDENEMGFCDAIQQFDALLDTVGNEWTSSNAYGRDDDDYDDDDTLSFSGTQSTSDVLNLLARRHNCHVYVSTQTAQQAILGQAGLLFGPGQAKEYVTSMNARNDNVLVTFPPCPYQLGRTMEQLFAAGITWPTGRNNPTLPVTFRMAASTKNAMIRTWTLGAYWEAATWPRDASRPQVRFGLPVLADEDENEDDPPLLMGRSDSAVEAPPMPYNKERMGDTTTSWSKFVITFSGVKGLQTKIIDPQLDCLLFLSAPYCRTCARMARPYEYLARSYSNTPGADNDNDNNNNNNANDRRNNNNAIVFAKADATGLAGRELGRYLDVNSVPTFVLFKRGKRFGDPLAISRLPSKKLEQALLFLNQDMAWDDTAFRDTDENSQQQRTPLRK